RLGDRIVVYDGGRVVQSAPRAELLWQPASEAVARIMDIPNVLHGRVIKATPDRIQLSWRGQMLEAVNSPTRSYLPPPEAPRGVLPRARVGPHGREGPGGRRSGPPHERHAWHGGGRRGLRHHVDAASTSRRGGPAGAGRLRSGSRGAAPGLRDPRDRSRPALGV